VVSLGTLSTSATRNGSIGGADPVDWFSFQVANSGATTIRLAGMSRDVDIHILDSSGRILQRGENSGTSSENLTVNLQAGQNYFIRVYPDGSGPVSNYQLTINPPRPSAPNNDTMAGATPLGNIFSTQRWVSGRVGAGNPADWFSFTPSAGAGNYVRISLVSLTQDIDVELLDSNGNVVASSTNSGNSSEYLQVPVVNGRQYFIRVYPYNSAVSNYSLSVSHEPVIVLL
jgi:hypothetical protein